MEFIKNKAFLSNFLAVLFFIFVGAVFAFIIWGHSVIEKNEREYAQSQTEYRQRRTAETVGTITDYEERQFVKSKSHLVTYKYFIDGKSYSQNNQTPIGSYETHRKGVEGKVCYDPADLQNAFFSLKEENIICGS